MFVFNVDLSVLMVFVFLTHGISFRRQTMAMLRRKASLAKAEAKETQEAKVVVQRKARVARVQPRNLI